MTKINGGLLIESLVATIILIAVLGSSLMVVSQLSAGHSAPLEGISMMQANAWIEESIRNNEFSTLERSIEYGNMRRYTQACVFSDELIILVVEVESLALKYPMQVKRLVQKEMSME